MKKGVLLNSQISALGYARDWRSGHARTKGNKENRPLS